MSTGSKRRGSAAEVGAAFLKLGLSSFGGPVAHLGYFRREFVERRSIRFLVGAQQPLQGAFGAMHRLQAAIGSRQQ